MSRIVIQAQRTLGPGLRRGDCSAARADGCEGTALPGSVIAAQTGLVIPAQAGIQAQSTLGFGLRRGDQRSYRSEARLVSAHLRAPAFAGASSEATDPARVW